MFAFLFGAQQPTDGAIGARLGRWIDGNFATASAVAIGVTALVLVSIVLLARAYGRQLRRNRRMRRLQDAALHQQLHQLAARVDELRGDVRQLAELNDHVVGQIGLVRRGLNLEDVTIDLRSPAERDRSWRPERGPSERGPSGWRDPHEQLEVSPASIGGSSPSWLSRQSRRRVSFALTESRATPQGPFGPALLVETGEPMAWATRQQ